MPDQSRRRPDPNATPAQGISRTRVMPPGDEMPRPPRVRRPWPMPDAVRRWAAGLSVSPELIMAILAALALAGCILSALLFARLATCRMAEAQTGKPITLVECLFVGP
jgi:hypothetical protein